MPWLKNQCQSKENDLSGFWKKLCGFAFPSFAQRHKHWLTPWKGREHAAASSAVVPGAPVVHLDIPPGQR